VWLLAYTNRFALPPDDSLPVWNHDINTAFERLAIKLARIHGPVVRSPRMDRHGNKHKNLLREE
jgi:hypothetical protein